MRFVLIQLVKNTTLIILKEYWALQRGKERMKETERERISIFHLDN